MAGDKLEANIRLNKQPFEDDLEEVKWIPKSRVLGECSNQATELWPEEIKSYFSYHPNL